MIVDSQVEGWCDRIASLKKQTQNLREQRQKLAKELKAAQRKNKRLKERARCLSEEDMVQILVMKRQKMAESAVKDSEEQPSSSSGSSAASTPIASDMQPASPPRPMSGSAMRDDEDLTGMRMDP